MIEPIPLNKIELKENNPVPKNVGIYPPIIEPMNIPKNMRVFEDMYSY